jgi:hypothetical protein
MAHLLSLPRLVGRVEAAKWPGGNDPLRQG